MSRPLVIAHRGYSTLHVENTLSSYRAAIEAGADLIESDARLSADGVVIAAHDADLERLTGKPLAIADATLAELRAIELPRGERILTLAEVLAAVCPQRPVLIDVKRPEIALIEAVMAVVLEGQWAEQAWVGVRDLDQAKRARALSPAVRILAFLPDYRLADAFAEAGASAFRVWESHLGDPVVQRLIPSRPVWVTVGHHDSGRKVGDADAQVIAAILRLGVAGLLLNDPTLLVAGH